MLIIAVVSTLQVAKGAWIMLLRNICTEDGLVNEAPLLALTGLKATGQKGNSHVGCTSCLMVAEWAKQPEIVQSIC